MRKNAIALENIRSAYNVGNIIRTADWLGLDVILLWYTPTAEELKVLKTSLWAEKNVNLKDFYNVKKWIEYIKKHYDLLVWAELDKHAVSIWELEKYKEKSICLLVGNEVDWISLETMEVLDLISFIPMQWVKNSLNVCEASSIFMYEITRK